MTTTSDRSQPPRLLHDVDSAAAVLSVSVRTVKRLIQDGELESVKLGTRRLVPQVALEDYVERLRLKS